MIATEVNYMVVQRFPRTVFDKVNARILKYIPLKGRRVVSVVVVGDAMMRRLNREWRSKDKTTDVLSFSFLESFEQRQIMASIFPKGSLKQFQRGKRRARSDLTSISQDQETYMGEIVINCQEAQRQAKQKGIALSKEIMRLYTHGFLHVIGFCHSTAASARRMESVARAVLDGL